MPELMTTGSASLTAELREHYNKELLYTATPELVHDKHARKYPIPRGEGKTASWRRYRLLDPATTPLTEGVTPAGNKLSMDKISVTVQQYGDFVPFSDVVTVTSIDPVMQANTEVQGQQAGNTVDTVARDVYNAGLNVRYANGRTSRGTVAAGDVMAEAEIKKLRRSLARKNVRKIGGYYIAIIHPDTTVDIQSTDAWNKTAQYQDKAQIETGMVFRLFGIQFEETSNAKVFYGAGAAGIDVYSTLCFGADALGSATIESLGLEMIYKGLGSGGTEDPLNQRQTQGWKLSYAAKILNEDYVVRLEHAVSN
jgi:N4-gp56 family major capsid protein